MTAILPLLIACCSVATFVRQRPRYSHKIDEATRWAEIIVVEQATLDWCRCLDKMGNLNLHSVRQAPATDVFLFEALVLVGLGRRGAPALAKVKVIQT